MQGGDLVHMKTGRYLYCSHLCLLIISSEFCGSAFTFFLCFLVGFLINDGRVETVAKIMDSSHQSLCCSVIGWRMLVSICQLIIEGMLITTDAGDYRLASFVDEQRMCRLYEKFILEYYTRHYPALSVRASQIPWSLDDGVGTMLPVMQSDIHLQRGNTVLIIDAKYYSNTTQVQFDKHTLHSNNLYQIFTYVKNRSYQFGEKENTVSGMLLYAKTEEEIQPDNVYQMHGSQISVKTLDLNLPFAEIASQMDRIVETHFSGLTKAY